MPLVVVLLAIGEHFSHLPATEEIEDFTPEKSILCSSPCTSDIHFHSPA